MEYVMHSKLTVGSAAALMGIATFAFTTAPRAQSAREAELIGFHQLCNKGDRKACIRFGIMLGENRERHAEWRKLHADWWWWER
jgi:hypothetical protein